IDGDGTMKMHKLINSDRELVINKLDSHPIDTTVVDVEIKKKKDWNYIDRVYQGLREESPVIQDAYSDKLINQLVDLDLAEEIVEDGGFTFEGDMMLSTRGA